MLSIYGITLNGQKTNYGKIKILVEFRYPTTAQKLVLIIFSCR